MTKDLEKYGGDLRVLPLCGMIKRGRGDDVVVVIDHEAKSRYGCLDVRGYGIDFEELCLMAQRLTDGDPAMIAVDDPESGSSLVLVNAVQLGERTHYLAVIFNACFSDPEENRKGSYCLRMTKTVDPLGRFSERIMYAPGQRIEWNTEQLKALS